MAVALRLSLVPSMFFAFHSIEKVNDRVLDISGETSCTSGIIMIEPYVIIVMSIISTDSDTLP